MKAYKRRFLLAGVIVVALAAMGDSARGQSVTIAWDPPAASDVMGYRVYRDSGLVADTANLTATIPVVYDVTHTIWVTSYDSQLRESVPSLSVAHRAVPPPPDVCAPDGTGNGVDEDLDGQYDETCVAPPPSPNGFVVPNQGWRLVALGSIWTMRYDVAGSNRGFILRDYGGTGGYGVSILGYNGAVYGQDIAGGWWRYQQGAEPGFDWVWVTGDPRAGQAPPPAETCGADGYGNGVDDDGDGLVDEGCLTPPPTGCLTGGTLAPVGSTTTQSVRNGEVDVFVTARLKEGWALVSKHRAKKLTTLTLVCQGL